MSARTGLASDPGLSPACSEAPTQAPLLLGLSFLLGKMGRGGRLLFPLQSLEAPGFFSCPGVFGMFGLVWDLFVCFFLLWVLASASLESQAPSPVTRLLPGRLYSGRLHRCRPLPTQLSNGDQPAKPALAAAAHAAFLWEKLSCDALWRKEASFLVPPMAQAHPGLWGLTRARPRGAVVGQQMSFPGPQSRPSFPTLHLKS